MVPAASWKVPEFMEDGFPKFSPKSVSRLQSLISVNTTIILTTSHRSKITIVEWVNIFKSRGIKVGKLKSLEINNGLNRKDEILKWFNDNNFNDTFIIIDDDKSLNDLPTHLKDHLILTNPLVGLI